MKTIQPKLGDFDAFIEQCQENLRQNEIRRQQEFENEKREAQSFKDALDADSSLKELFKETDKNIGLADIIQQRTGVSLY